MPPTTPFKSSGRVLPENFFGRTDTVRAAVHALRGGSSVAIYGGPRTGKSSLLNVLFKNYRYAERDALVWYIEMARLNSLTELLDEFYIGMKLRKEGGTLLDFAAVLKGWKQRFVLFIDQGERFARPPFHEEAFFALLSAHLPARQISLCVTTALSPDQVFVNRIGQPLHSLLTRIDLQPYSMAEAEELIRQRLQWTGVHFHDDEVEALYKESGGWPGELQRRAAELFRKKMDEAGNKGTGVQHTGSGRKQ